MNYIIELAKDSHEHELVNSCALYIWQDVFDHDTQFFGSQGHKEALEQFLPDLKIDAYNRINILPRKKGNKLQWVKIYLHEISSVFKFLNQAKKNKIKQVIFLSISPIALLFAKLYLKFNTTHSNVIFTFHGELQLLVQDKLRLSQRLVRSIIKLNLVISNKQINYVVYGQTIKDKLISLFPDIKSQVLSLEHPFQAKCFENFVNVDLNRIGAFGAISQHKNSHRIIELAELMHKIAPQLQFKLVGKFIDRPLYDDNLITVVGGDEFLSRTHYEKEILDTSWLIYLYEDRNYELISSGAFLDAILYNKPIICLKNNFFKNVFENYEIGIMVDSIEALPMALEALFTRDNLHEFYVKCQINIRRYFDDYQLNEQASLLKEKLGRFANYQI